MRKAKIFKYLSLILMLAMAVSLFAACAPKETTGTTAGTTTTQATTTEGTTTEATTTRFRQDTPLVVGYSAFSEKFSPFFSDTSYDTDVVSMTSVSLLTTDRTGAIVYNAIEGETLPYAGTDYEYKGIADVDVNYDEAAGKTVYTWTIRDDVMFSDGELMTADDVIFTYYVYSDPTYTGSTTLYSVPVLGMTDYRTQTTSAVYNKYSAMFDEIYAAGEDHEWAESDAWTKEQQDSMWAILKDAWKNDIQLIVNEVVAKYIGYSGDLGVTAEEVLADDGLQVALGMYAWGFGEPAEDGTFTTYYNEVTFDIPNGQYPTLDDFYAETYTAYEGNPEAFFEVEAASNDATKTLEDGRFGFIREWGPKDEEMGGQGVPNIAGIKKVSDTVVEVTVEGYDATAIYSLGIQVSPLHYYGDESKYDYDNDKFGFDYSDLSLITAKTTQPLGAGPYKFVKYENKIVYFEANENYYKGEPIITNVQFKESTDADKISGVGTGTLDLTEPSFSAAAREEIKSYNSNGEVSGDKIVTSTVDFLGYGYIGLNAETINVGGVADSEESKNLRKGLATILSVYRELTVSSYYGEQASVINYPISNTSWASPQPTDEGYKVAFSTAVDGSDIFTSDMDPDARYEAAKAAAIDYFVAAGYTFDEASGKLTEAPDGASLEYEIIIPGDGQGDHPSFLLVTKAKEAFESIGIDLIVNDPTNSNDLWNTLDAATQEMWVAAWQATIDPDMYQVYHSSNIVGLGGSESNHYHIADSQLDELIIEARTSDDQSFRKQTYKACLDIIIDWAVEIPVYQRQEATIFSVERVNMDTVTPDITTFWGWMNDIELLQMNEG